MFLEDDFHVTETGKQYSVDQRKALVYYLTEFYLPILRDAGHHTLYSLPDFAATTSPKKVDYSVISTRDLPGAELFGVSVEDINGNFRRLWGQATEYIKQNGFSDDRTGFNFLAEMRATKIINGVTMDVQLSLGPMNIQALCKTEIVLYLAVQDILVFHEGLDRYVVCLYSSQPIPHHLIISEPKEHLRDWKIAFIIDLFEVTQEGTGKYIRFDVESKSLRYAINEI